MKNSASKSLLFLASATVLAGVALFFFGGRDSEFSSRVEVAPGNAQIPSHSAAEQMVDFPAGTVDGEAIFVFENPAALQDFLAEAKKNGWKIRGSLSALNAVRVVLAPSLIGRKIPGLGGADFNYNLNIPDAEQIASRELAPREGGGSGNVPVGKNALAQMGVTPENLARSRVGEGVLIAVLDSGVFAEHPALNGVPVKVIDVAKGVADTAESVAHGTAVASLIAGNGTEGIVGMAQGAEILSVRVFDGAGSGDTFTLSTGIIAAVDAGAQVINISAGVLADSGILRSAVAYAVERGVTIVAAAGNEGVTSLAYPAAYPGVISVGAVDGNGNSAAFSNIGESLSVVAPGVGVIAAGTAEESSGAVSFSGTSASAPLVSGLVAATLSDAGTVLPPSEIAAIVENNSNDRGLPGTDPEYGSGLVDYERISRPAGTAVSDVRVSDFYVKKASGGNTNPGLVVGVQNRGNVWSGDAVLSLTMTFANGTVSISTATLGMLPVNASTGVLLDLPAGTLAEGVRIDAELKDKNGKVLDQTAVKLKQ